MADPYRPDQYPEVVTHPVHGVGDAHGYYARIDNDTHKEASNENDTHKEARSDNETGKEVAPQYYPAQYQNGQYLNGSNGVVEKAPWVAAAAPGAHHDGSADLPQPVSTAPTAWWKRKRIWVSAIVALLVIIIAVVVGCVVGLKKSSSPSEPAQGDSAGSSPGPNGTTTNAKSLCRGTTCNPLFSAERFNDQIHLFARGDDDAYWTRVHDGKSWVGDWLSLGGKFQSQPDSMVWGRVRSRMSLMGVSTNGTMMMKYYYTNNTWDSDWFTLNATTNSPVTSCYVPWGNPFDHGDLYARSPVNTVQGLMRGTIYGEGDENYKNVPDPDHTCLWETFDRGGSVGSSVAVVCRDSNLAQDMVMYQRGTGSVAHLQWKDGGLTSWTDRGGAFAGEPVLAALSTTDPDNRVDFFGTGQDRHIHHFTWTKSGNYTPMEDIGGDFQSVPTVLTTSSGRYDLLACGTDDRLKHRAYVGGQWAADWEDLGYFCNSAPYAFPLSSSTYQIGVFVLGEKNDIQFATWEVSSDISWKKMSTFESIQGKMTGAWMASEA
ncbi:hypothetical protein QBC47DRAFT_333061 [Echria macrotheca]|uniref:PLL-like beta propeller domain-containing protein n=1 Tax=Echria macrotheca TaxID=438768 RepID=A0AAJ0B1B1_9PEZI|nr:hypothetical protein QBC47DRAFT_333061 [Echria macrotheca]